MRLAFALWLFIGVTVNEYSDAEINDVLEGVRKMDNLNWKDMLVIIITTPIAIAAEWVKKIFKLDR